MGRSEPPFIYDPPSRQTPVSPTKPFNPKAHTQASWAPREPKAKKNGPLVNFNQHPDSFGLIAGGRGNIKLMSPRTKQRVKYARWSQLALRVLTLIGALGILFCVICIKGTTLTLAWMIRVPPCVTILHTIYGIYHLFRSATARTPASSASYMLFASVLDAGLIPLYVFTSIVSNVEYETKSYGWETLFGNEGVREAIIHATFLAASTVGGLHLISLGLDLYLAIVFRQISKLPPDMNPLEDNLTSRGQKRNKSEIAEKHLSQSTTGSAEANRESLAQEPLIPTRTVPFMHTRADSSSTLSGSDLRGTDSPRTSYYSAQSFRYSRSDLPSQQTFHYEQANKSKVEIARTPAQRRGTTPSRPQSMVRDAPPVSDQSNLTALDARQRDPSGVSALSDENWCIYPSSPPSPELCPDDSAARPLSLPNGGDTPMIPGIDDEKWDNSSFLDSLQCRSDTVVQHRGDYTAIDDCDNDEIIYGNQHAENSYVPERDLGDHQVVLAQDENNDYKHQPLLNPLEMNPPTPRPTEQGSVSSRHSKGSLRRVALADVPNPPSDSGRPTPVKSAKFRSYGKLDQGKISPAQRVGSLRGKDLKVITPNITDKKKSRWRRMTGNYEAVNDNDHDSDSDRNDSLSDQENRDRTGRVVSNTGIDLGLGLGSKPAGYGSYIAGLGVGRRREVSGKMAEEGRGSRLAPEDDDYEGKGKRLSKTGEYRAAGWARFRGL
ncbi:hypothetical protein CPC735_064640 [Coccidioides posadasii C735 delta SOWgp]|uniref:Uncharacterized protein n=1 Tax=Coccidioides posadasii (strain C735) TaxID=222929 RepID=C5PBN7_COCP7|nr:hypothetical protein CPC735_064640 [Coccidioides posadasii C735 delta SOWgp]EER25364.1 hypothetical protein CPC735_064640 [Coccidioides posadasii C735 delta SOWgp]|eukprot:XP_003067509.1 hypothetical protein CPC735_064640 [Coccidioides posadasii C735 delta SOWgp]